jgi:RNA polymerase sigma factor (sigma-70 family)
MEKFDVAKFKKGDEKLFRKIVDSYGERLYNIVLRIIRDVDDAEDIVQETLATAYMKRKTFRGKSSIYTWLVRIAYNYTINFAKKKSSHMELSPILPSNNNPEKRMERKETAELISNAIKELPPKQKTIFTLRFYENMSYKNISSILKCKQGTAKAQYHFAVEKLGNKLHEIKPLKEKSDDL